jgi:hypothetical protein
MGFYVKQVATGGVDDFSRMTNAELEAFVCVAIRTPRRDADCATLLPLPGGRNCPLEWGVAHTTVAPAVA